MKKILIIEDDYDIAQLLKLNLKAEGYDVIIATNGEKGVEIARKIRPNIVTLDILFPTGKSGFEILKEWLNDNKLKDIPVLVISIVNEDEIRKISKDINYLSKPIDFEKLNFRIRNLLN